MNKQTFEMLSRLRGAGISVDDSYALRRISMTLHRWHELECGNSDNYKSYAIERDGDEDDSPPYMVYHFHTGPAKPVRYRIPDRENGARKRLAKILARYPGWQAYVQGDPRGCALYLLPPGTLQEGENASSVYNRGIPVYA